MHWIDWLIVTIPLLLVLYIGLKAQSYVKGVSDFQAAGRVAGRYVLSIASGEANIGLIYLVGSFEAHYRSGFVYGYWNHIAAPISLILLLTGYCFYRFRETRALTLGQFLEIRYSRSFRVFAGILQSITGIINYGIFPAVGARFLVYFCDLPLEINYFGWIFPTFALIMALFLFIAASVAVMGGQITVMASDCIQGLLSYPLYAIVVGYLLYRFSWFDDMAPALLDRPPEQSLLNPFDIKSLRDFNIVYIVIAIIGNSILNRMSWSGAQGYNAAGLNAHEQKMGAVLGAWRTGFYAMMVILLAISAFTFLNNSKFSDGTAGSVACRNDLAVKAFDDIARDKQFDPVRAEFKEYIATGEIQPDLQKRLDAKAADPDLIDFNKDFEQEPMMAVGQDYLETVSKKEAQTFKTIFGQMRVPTALRYVLPVGITGIFCALCIFLMITTDTTYMHSWGSIIIQDVVLPLRGKPFTPGTQLRLLRFSIVGVAVFAFFFGYFFGQVDYIFMFFAITGAIWMGGAGTCIVGGLYWKRGTAAGAWVALITGSTIAVSGILGQQYWVESIYPWLVETGGLETVKSVVEGVSAPLEPYILWRVTPESFPINSMEIYGINIIMTVSLYVIVSLLTCRQPFNMDRMLHRGAYQREGVRIEKKKLTVRTALLKILGINEEYTRGDKILAWSVFIYSFGWGFLVTFGVVVIWNWISPWTATGWANWFFINNVIIAGVIAVVSTIWFSIGGTLDLRRMFKRLDERESNILDDGRVIDHVSADDIAMVEQIDQVDLKEPIQDDTMTDRDL